MMSKRCVFALLLAVLLAVIVPAVAEDEIDWEIFWTVEMKDEIDIGSIDRDLLRDCEVRNYIAKDGTTSALIRQAHDQDVIWIKEASGGTSAWYGIDISKNVFEEGSRFWVRWVNNADNSKEWNQLYSAMDDCHKQKIEDDNLWIFQIGVTGPDGKEYIEPSQNVPLYVQIGEDWDKQNIHAAYIAEGVDETMSVSYTESRDYPEGKDKFVKLTLSHFSPYVIYETQSTIAADLPQTGDESRMGLWLALLALSGAAGLALRALRRREN